MKKRFPFLLQSILVLAFYTICLPCYPQASDGADHDELTFQSPQEMRVGTAFGIGMLGAVSFVMLSGLLELRIFEAFLRASFVMVAAGFLGMVAWVPLFDCVFVGHLLLRGYAIVSEWQFSHQPIGVGYVPVYTV